ncbi:YadA-like family protein [uncultured Sneathia sp.]|uniref:YadA family autotransporter adhesin n=1 Tax=uncultured Sneathia sp. TaxID=278067 RepID=UPI00259B8A9E|nr:YadA-like family protein [uncultured Sneathia sp.]
MNRKQILIIILSIITGSITLSEDKINKFEMGKNSYVEGSNGISLTENSISIGTNSNSLDEYFKYYIPILNDKSKKENEIQKTKAEIDNRVNAIKERYINRLNYIKSQLKIINNFFNDKQKVEEKLKQVTDDRDKFIKASNTIILKQYENNFKLITQIGDYRATLRKIADYLMDKKGLVNSEEIEKATFKDGDDDNRNYNLNKAKIKRFINDELVWNYLKLDDEKNLKKYLSDCIRYKLKEPMAGNVYDINVYYGKEEDNDVINENVKDIKAKIKTYRLPLIQSFLEAHTEFEIDKMDKCSEEIYKIVFRNKVSYYDVNTTREELKAKVKEWEEELNKFEGRLAYFTEWKGKFNDELKGLLKSIKYEGEDNLAYGTSSYAIGMRSYAIGTNALTMGVDSVTIGSYSATFGNGSNSVGEKNYTKGNKNQVFGVENITVGNSNILHGNNNAITGETNTVLGNNNNLGRVIPTYNDWKKIDGNASKNESDYTTYLNSEYKYNEWQSKNSGKTVQDFINQSYVKNNVILGSNIKNTDVNNAVVIGNGSEAIENAVSFGNDKTKRQLKFVAEGKDDTDAVNVKQLKDYVATNSSSGENYYTKPEVDKKLEGINAKSNLALGGVANAIAMSSMTQPREGLVNITGAYGTYGGEHALAVGISGNTERFSYKLGVSTNMRGNVGVGLGFGMTVVSSTKDDVIKRMEKKILEYMKETKEQNEKIKELENEMKELKKLIKKN